jgi:hypothetical protein
VFAGQLMRDGTSEGVGGLNILPGSDAIVPCRPDFGTMPRPFPLQTGATLAGKVSSGKVAIVVRGKSKDLTRQFQAEIVASR